MDVVLPKEGSYVVAVSGGVDSVVLLDMLSREPELKLVVAHFDHGTRKDSSLDRSHVQRLASRYGLPFVFDEGRLGPAASEAMARDARYAFLRRIKDMVGAHAIITAHHQDDLLETAIINMLRGTGRKGLTSLASRNDMVRPLLKVPKSYLIAYAQDQGLGWRDDPTNQDTAYLRNHVRHNIMTKFDDKARAEMLGLLDQIESTNQALDQALAGELARNAPEGSIDRMWFIRLPHETAREIMAGWLRAQGIADFGSKTLERLVVAAKVAEPGRRFPVLSGYDMVVDQSKLALERPER